MENSDDLPLASMTQKSNKHNTNMKTDKQGQHTAQKQKGPYNSKIICHNCKEAGHTKRNCPQLKRRSPKENPDPKAPKTACDTCGKAHPTNKCWAGANAENAPEWFKNPKPQRERPNTRDTYRL